MTKAENRKARACTLPNGSRRRAGYRRGPVFMLCRKRVKMQRSLQLKIIRADYTPFQRRRKYRGTGKAPQASAAMANNISITSGGMRTARRGLASH